MLHAVEASALLVVGLDDRPGRIGRIRIEEHGLLGLGVFIPLVLRLLVDRAQFPLLQRIAGRAH